MSGTLASRFQGRFGYGPGLAVGRYGPQTFGQTLPGPSGGQGQGQATPAPAQPAQTPVAAGAAPVPANPDPNGDGPEGTASNMGMGPSPGTLGGGLSGWGVGTYGTAGSVLGGLASLATGVPGLGLAAGALGTYADAREANGMLADFGLAPSIDWGQAALSNATLGLAGQSIDTQLSAVSPLGSTWGAYAGIDPEVFGLPRHELDLPAAGADEAPPDIGSYLDTMQPEPDMPMAAVDPGSYGGFGGPGGSVGGSGPSGGGDFGDYGDMGDPGGYGDATYMRGGYTGAGADGVVQPAQPAGTVHEGEVVIPAHAVQQYGLPLLMQLAQGNAPSSRLAALMRGD